MGTTLTTNYSLIKPNPFEEEDTWGSLLNTNWDSVDSILFGKQAKTTATTALAAVTPAADTLPYFTSASAAATTTITAFGRTILTSASAAALNTTLGLGTANSPTFAGMSLTGSLFMDTNALYQPQIKKTHASATAGSSPYLIHQRARGSIASPVIVQNGDALGQFLITGHDGTGFINAASISASVDGTPATNSMPTRLVFGTTPSGSAGPLERMRIDSAGNVTVGSDSVNTLRYLDVANANTGASAGVDFRLITSNAAGVGTAVVDLIKFKTGAFYINNNEPTSAASINFGTAGTTRMFIDGIGNVGIGEGSSGARLHVRSGANSGVLATDGTVSNILYTSGGTAGSVGTITGHPLHIYANNAPRIIIDTSGNVGIGGTPNAKFDVVGPAGGASARFTDNTNSTLTIKHEGPSNFITYDAGGSSQHRWVGNSVERMRIDGSGNVMVNGAAALAKFNTLGNVSAQTTVSGAAGYYITNASAVNGIGLSYDFAGNTAYLDYKSTIYMRDSGASFAPRLVIDGNGNVTVGQTVAGNTLRFLDVQNTDTGASAGAIIRLITQNAAGTNAATVDIVRYRSGYFAIANSEGGISLNCAGVERLGINGTTGNVLINSAGGGIGYGPGSGGSVAQATNRTTGVTLNKTNGQITLTNATMTLDTFASFTVTNSTVAATDTIIVNFASGASADKYSLTVTAVSAGSFRIQLYAIKGVGTAEQPVINFSVLKAANS